MTTQDVRLNYTIAIYAICKNEEKYVDKWMKSMLEADKICVLDTGSTDNTYKLLQAWQEKYPNKIILKQQVITPWRFDVARNESIKLIPKDIDICWCTDLDEILIKGWSAYLRRAWNDSAKQGWYLYAWSHNQDGTPARTFWYNKIHSNDPAWQWKSPVHEGLVYNGSAYNVKPNESVFLDRNVIFLHHYPDPTKGRGNYLPLLELRAQEEQNDFYGCLYLLHQYLYEGPNYYAKGIDYGIHHMIPLAYTCPEAADSGSDILRADMFYFIGQMLYSSDRKIEAERMFRLGVTADPLFRENYIALCNMLVDEQKVEEALDLYNTMIKKTVRRRSWVEFDDSWSWKPYDILSRIYFSSNHITEAKHAIEIALQYVPYNERLKNNYKIICDVYNQAVNGGAAQ